MDGYRPQQPGWPGTAAAGENACTPAGTATGSATTAAPGAQHAGDAHATEEQERRHGLQQQPAATLTASIARRTLTRRESMMSFLHGLRVPRSMDAETRGQVAAACRTTAAIMSAGPMTSLHGRKAHHCNQLKSAEETTNWLDLPTGFAVWAGWTNDEESAEFVHLAEEACCTACPELFAESCTYPNRCRLDA